MRNAFINRVVLGVMVFAALDSLAKAQDSPAERAWKAIRGGDPDAAIAICSERIVAGDSSFYITRGWAYHNKGDYDRAISDYSTALASRLTIENQSMAYNNRADSYLAKGEFSRAIADARRALDLNPNNPEANSTLANYLASCPDEKLRDPKLAWQYATRAFELKKPPTGNFYDTVACAYAANEDWDHAVEYAQKALNAGNFGDPSEVNEVRKRLRLFEQHKPYFFPLAQRK
jgi:tetratricopeptide (TPR) repeat protein